MWTGYKILIFSYLATEIWTEGSSLSGRDAGPGAASSRNHSSSEGCLRDGQHFEEGSVIKENCNPCTCSQRQWRCSQHACLVRPELLEHINNGDFGWTAQNYSQFWGMTLQEGFTHRLGTMPPGPTLLSMSEVTASLPAHTDLPEIFISSYKWPGWTHGPLDQKNCAASWAFSTASVAADRIAIHSKGQYTANLSPQNLISCCAKSRLGCHGGSIDRAWWFLRKRGLVSHACYPLLRDPRPDAHACAMESRAAARGRRQATRPCPNSLEKSNRIFQCSPAYRVSSNETEIMREIMQNGPVQAIMQVHEDFFHYKTGIYRHVASSREESKYRKLRSHAVKLTGSLPIPGESLGERMAILGFSAESMSLILRSSSLPRGVNWHVPTRSRSRPGPPSRSAVRVRGPSTWAGLTAASATPCPGVRGQRPSSCFAQV
ncbi:tubulointerstitial nephritis antigen isoform X3 [Dipodomys spectabilis]|uniref:tubulointerstitial nephritis antigen isoform X3 n=1 Tax=Dipodomys spectabilis TaxID=105255 RepID=UPI001C53C256|nr:tubulointerstitial nephritis antigen isoform X3 [Dipodomys spectabilis]